MFTWTVRSAWFGLVSGLGVGRGERDEAGGCGGYGGELKGWEFFVGVGGERKGEGEVGRRLCVYLTALRDARVVPLEPDIAAEALPYPTMLVITTPFGQLGVLSRESQERNDS